MVYSYKYGLFICVFTDALPLFFVHFCLEYEEATKITAYQLKVNGFKNRNELDFDTNKAIPTDEKST